MGRNDQSIDAHPPREGSEYDPHIVGQSLEYSSPTLRAPIRAGLSVRALEDGRPSRFARQVITVLKKQRTDRNMTVAEVAEASGVDKSVISRFENETTDPRWSTLMRYAHAVGADLEVVVAGVRLHP